ncbi:hypothetical protein KUCAC02_008658 [Chaenocephalus aceratus]|uniref:Uncharacterized protein n=1 Tax=Chaenocephalus aceratus TaxID=36190 RepID=A0ACB9WR61_CHAAC|nr:hypothetical protein KUCAC02_008658 [Chaenocephalus aceratus]
MPLRIYTDSLHLPDFCPLLAANAASSCLRRIKNYLRNSSGDARNSNLGLLAINKQRSKALDVQQRVIDIFASNHNNRRIVLL